MYCVYILYSKKSEKFYIGLTDSIEKRIQEHNSPDNHGWTKKFQPWIVSYFEAYLTASEARKKELSLKQQQKTINERQSHSLPTLSSLRVRSTPAECLRLWCSPRYQRISPLHREFHQPLMLSSLAVSYAALGLSPKI